jgi:hypothetical protein
MDEKSQKNPWLIYFRETYNPLKVISHIEKKQAFLVVYLMKM